MMPSVCNADETYICRFWPLPPGCASIAPSCPTVQPRICSTTRRIGSRIMDTRSLPTPQFLQG